MIFAILASSLIALQATPAATEQPTIDEKAEPQIEVIETKPAKITDKKHPDYVRCKKESIIGSRARKRKICKTNQQWAAAARDGNRHSRELIEANSPGFNSGG